MVLQRDVYNWTTCRDAQYKRWRNPKLEKARLTESTQDGKDWSLFLDPLLRVVWEARKTEPSKNKMFGCTAMVVAGANMDPVWIKIPCNHKFLKAAVICVRQDPSLKKKCNKDLPTLDSEGNVNRKHAPQWERNVTCSPGWTMNPGNVKCYQTMALIPPDGDFEVHYRLALHTCRQQNGEIADVTEENFISTLSLLTSMKVRPEYGSIWIKGYFDAKEKNGCSILKPGAEGVFQRAKDNLPCNETTSKKTAISSVLCVKDPVPQNPLPSQVLHQCDDGAYILKFHLCDGLHNCRDGSDETNCELTGQGSESNFPKTDNCSPLHFECNNSTQCISWSKVCNGVKDCINSSSDEQICKNKLPPYFTCKNGQVIDWKQSCDISYDCLDGSDETDCVEYNDASCVGSLYDCRKLDKVHKKRGILRQSWIDEMIKHGYGHLMPLTRCWQMSQSLHPCQSVRDGCFHKEGLCVHDKLPNNVPAYCLEREHLQDCEDHVCPGKFKCDSGYCIPFHRVCDNRIDCLDGDDEIKCEMNFCNSSFWCDGVCLSSENLCDGIKQCYNGDDELMCDMSCPAACTCLAHAVNCNGAKLETFPDISSKRMKAILLSQNFLNSTGIQKLESAVLHELVTLDLSFNEIESIDSKFFLGKSSLSFLNLQSNLLVTIPEDCFKSLTNLRDLGLSNNHLHTIQYRGFYGLRSLPKLDLSGMRITDIEDHAFGNMKSLTHLNLSLNQISFIGADVFKDLPELTHLNLSGNLLHLIDTATFQGLSKLQSLHTSDYKFCCAAQHVENCLPKPDVYSSCNDLMSSVTLRVFIWLLGFFSLLGNIAVVFYRSQMEKPSVLSFLVHNLGIADFMMGVYLLVIAGADAYYRGVYYLHDSIWRSHFVCRAAGFLSMLSSEMSVYVLVLITTDRVLAVGLGKKSFSDTVAKILTSAGWVTFIALSLLPVTNIPYFGIDEYIQHGVCFLFNLTEGKVSGWEYATAIFIAFNLFALLYLVLGYSFTFVRVLINPAISGDAEVQLARKLALVVLTDCVCWIPPITIGIISLHGVTIDPQVSMWIAVFVFPINSSLNPFLYTFSTCGQKPGKSDDSDLDNPVTQMDGRHECHSLSEDDCEYAQGAVGGTPHKPTKTVRFISVVDEVLPPKEFNKCHSIDEAEDIGGANPAGGGEFISFDNPICRVNSADSGIVDNFTDESPSGFGRKQKDSFALNDGTSENQSLDTAF